MILAIGGLAERNVYDKNFPGYDQKVTTLRVPGSIPGLQSLTHEQWSEHAKANKL